LQPAFHLPSIDFHEGARIWPGVEYEEFSRRLKQLSARSLLMAGVEEPVVVDRLPDEGYLRFLHGCGAGGTPIMPESSDGATLADDVAVSPVLVQRLRDWEGRFELYLPSEADERLAAVAGRPLTPTPWKVANLLNDKIFFLRLCEDLGLDHPPAFVGNSDAVGARIRIQPERALIVRASSSVGGSCVWPVRNDGERKVALKFLDAEGRDRLFLLQPCYEVASSPNLQFYLTEERIHFFGRTVQALDERLRHYGNLFDPVGITDIDDEALDIGRRFAQTAHLLGYRGVLGIDFIVTTEGKLYPVEQNARHNTSSHALMFLNRYFGGDSIGVMEGGRGAYIRFAGASANVADTMARLGVDLFNPATGRGLVPYADGSGVSFVVVGEDSTDRARLIEAGRSMAVK
jgi:hypothetical protein